MIKNADIYFPNTPSPLMSANVDNWLTPTPLGNADFLNGHPLSWIKCAMFYHKNDELSINTIRCIHEAKKIDMFSIFCFWRSGIFPHSDLKRSKPP